MGNRGIHFWRLLLFCFVLFSIEHPSTHIKLRGDTFVPSVSGWPLRPSRAAGGAGAQGSGRAAGPAGAAVPEVPLTLINLAVFWGCQSRSEANQLQKALCTTWAAGNDQQMNCTAIPALDGNSFGCV